MTRSGVYEIRNTINGKRYVGSAVNLPNRKRRHWRDLRKTCHHNRYLQRSWNKCGESAFEFEVLEYWEPEFLVSFEQWWLNMLQPEYNICKVAGSALGIKRTARFTAKLKARKHTDETKAQISAALKNRKFTDDQRSNMSKGRIGMKFSDEHRANMSAKRKGKPWSTARRIAEDARQAKNNTKEN